MLSSYRRGPRHPHPLPLPGPTAQRAPLTYFDATEHRAEDIKVYVNGEPQPLVKRASSIEGFCEVYVADGEGLKTDGLGRTVIVRLHGRVEIRSDRA